MPRTYQSSNVGEIKMHTINKNNIFINLKLLKVIVGFFLAVNVSFAAVFLDQATSINSAGSVMRAYRVPVTTTTGTKYYDITFDLTQDTTGKPVMKATFPAVALSPTLLVGQFKAGKYKDGCGNVYTVSGPGAAAGGRTTWGIILTKSISSSIGACNGGSQINGSWTTGPIAGHPLASRLTAQGISSTAYSWGTVTASLFAPLANCSGDAVGAAQSGNLLSLNGFCSGNSVQTEVLTLNLCTTVNPC